MKVSCLCLPSSVTQSRELSKRSVLLLGHAVSFHALELFHTSFCFISATTLLTVKPRTKATPTVLHIRILINIQCRPMGSGEGVNCSVFRLDAMPSCGCAVLMDIMVLISNPGEKKAVGLQAASKYYISAVTHQNLHQ